METKKITKKLTEEQKKDILNYILNKFELKNDKKSHDFYNSLVLYIQTVRRDISTFCKNIDDSLELFAKCGYDNDQIMKMLTNEPSLLHANKYDLFWRILILGKVIDVQTGEDVRQLYMINNPRILRTSQNITYARIKYLESDEGKMKVRRARGLTSRQITKVTHTEFFESYGISKEELLNKYPFNNDAQLEVISWPENKEFLDKIYKGKIK